MITVVTVNWYSVDLIKALLKNLYCKSQNAQEIMFRIIDNTNGADKAIEELRKLDIKCEIIHLDTKGLLSSAGHAYALDHVFNMIDTEFTLVIDPDVHVFMNNWDTFCINGVKDDNVLAIGAPYPSWKIGKYHNFPSPIFCFFPTDRVRQMKCKWKPHSNYKIADYYCLFLRLLFRVGGSITRQRFQESTFLQKFGGWAENIFGIFSRETGWRIAQQARKNKIQSILFDAVFPNETSLAPSSAIDAFEQLASEFELYYYRNEPVLTHKYSTGSKSWQTGCGHDVKFWKKCIEQFESEIDS